MFATPVYFYKNHPSLCRSIGLSLTHSFINCTFAFLWFVGFLPYVVGCQQDRWKRGPMEVDGGRRRSTEVDGGRWRSMEASMELWNATRALFSLFSSFSLFLSYSCLWWFTNKHYCRGQNQTGTGNNKQRLDQNMSRTLFVNRHRTPHTSIHNSTPILWIIRGKEGPDHAQVLIQTNNTCLGTCTQTHNKGTHKHKQLTTYLSSTT